MLRFFFMVVVPVGMLLAGYNFLSAGNVLYAMGTFAGALFLAASVPYVVT